MSFLKRLLTRTKACQRTHPDSTLKSAICTLAHPGKLLLLPVRMHAQRYRDHKRPKLRLSLDLFFIGLALGVLGTISFVVLHNKTSFMDSILLEVTLTPSPAISASVGTISIRYANQTQEALSEAQLRVTLPEGFVLDDPLIDPPIEKVITLPIGTLDIDEIGALKIRGLLYGTGNYDMETELVFTRPKTHKRFHLKKSIRTAPVTPGLTVTIEFPKEYAQGETVSGRFVWNHIGNASIPLVVLTPTWPEGFLPNKNNALQKGRFFLREIAPQSQGEITFSGVFKKQNDPSLLELDVDFLVQDTTYSQTHLTSTSKQRTSHLSLSQEILQPTLSAGERGSVRVRMSNTGNATLSNVHIELTSVHRFFEGSEQVRIDRLEPGEQVEKNLSFQLRKAAQPGTTDLSLLYIAPKVSYVIDEERQPFVETVGAFHPIPITTSIAVQQFGRYRMPSGDQIGRGPIPPVVGEKTTFWIFWTVKDTFGPIENITMHSSLPEGIEFTGRQSVSTGEALEFDPSTRALSWNLKEPIDTSQKELGVAFEIAFTPSQEDVHTQPILTHSLELTARDARTGAFIRAHEDPLTLKWIDDLIVESAP